MTEFSITPVSLDDILLLVHIDSTCSKNPWSYSVFEGEIKSELSQCFKLTCNNQIAGFICTWFIDDTVEIHNICVLPSFRNHGYATLLLTKILDIAKVRSLSHAILEVRVGNIAAISLYKKMGFKEIGFRKKYYSDSEDAVVMECQI